MPCGEQHTLQEPDGCLHFHKHAPASARERATAEMR